MRLLVWGMDQLNHVEGIWLGLAYLTNSLYFYRLNVLVS